MIIIGTFLQRLCFRGCCLMCYCSVAVRDRCNSLQFTDEESEAQMATFASREVGLPCRRQWCWCWSICLSGRAKEYNTWQMLLVPWLAWLTAFPLASEMYRIGQLFTRSAILRKQSFCTLPPTFQCNGNRWRDQQQQPPLIPQESSPQN